MYQLAVPPALQALDQGQHLLGMAPPEMLATRMARGMFTCEEQLETVAGFALRATYPLTGKTAPELPGGAVDALAAAKNAVKALRPAAFDGAETRIIAHRAGFAELSQPAMAYLQNFALPNLWFHLAMAYAVLRQAGAPVGKADFDGLHAYPTGFSFDDEV